MVLSHSARSDWRRRRTHGSEAEPQLSKDGSGPQVSTDRMQSLTGMKSGSHSGMFRLLISMEIFLRCPGLVTPMAVRSCRDTGQNQIQRKT